MPGIDGGVVMLGVRTSKMRKASMTELIEINVLVRLRAQRAVE
ncbi:hypothetical protein ECDEC9B_0256 [Escherichia coli DEC9B]|nr:hypothetical protein ECDEC9B_0256 [Escherichia coli DEC9B]